MSEFFEGIDPPSHALRVPECISEPRPCIECGKMHDTGFQDMRTGEMMKRLDKCYDCFMKTAYHIVPIKEQVMLDETDDKNIEKLKQCLKEAELKILHDLDILQK